MKFYLTIRPALLWICSSWNNIKDCLLAVGLIALLLALAIFPLTAFIFTLVSLSITWTDATLETSEHELKQHKRAGTNPLKDSIIGICMTAYFCIVGTTSLLISADNVPIEKFPLAYLILVGIPMAIAGLAVLVGWIRYSEWKVKNS